MTIVIMCVGAYAVFRYDKASAWTVDVLGLMGVPVLTAQLRSADDTEQV